MIVLPAKSCERVNDILLKSCTAIVDGGMCKAYGLHMMDMDANSSSGVKVSFPLLGSEPYPWSMYVRQESRGACLWHRVSPGGHFPVGR